MKLSLFFDHRFVRDESGSVFSLAAYNYDLLAERYLSVFDELRVVARVAPSAGLEREGRLAVGSGVSVLSLGDWNGPLQFFRQRKHMRHLVSDAVKQDSAVMLIAPGTIGQIAQKELQAVRPYGVEVVGDPYEVFAPGAINHPLRPIIRAWSTHKLKVQCEHARTLAYVNTTQLPERYPASNAVLTTSYSSIELRAEHFVNNPRTEFDLNQRLNIITVASLAVPYKGVDNLLEAFQKVLVRYGNARLTVVGDGLHRSALEQQARNLDIADKVSFLGRLPAGDAVRDQLDRSDLFILPSRTEGLPRAMIEAMARGLPAIGTKVGGIPELLGPGYLVPANDPQALANKVIETVSSSGHLAEMSKVNWHTAKNYRSDVLQGRRIAHYTALKEETREWQMRMNK